MLNIAGLKWVPMANEMVTGNVYFVDSNGALATAASGNVGDRPDRAVTTMDGGNNLCTTSRGDYVLMMPNHSETIASAGDIDLDVAGVTHVGLGYGNMVPTITLATATTVDIDIDAAGVTIKNVKFSNNINNCTAPFDVNAADFTMINCETTYNDSTTHVDDWFLTDSNADRLTIIDHVHRGNVGGGGLTGGISLVKLRGGPTNVIVQPKWIDGDFSGAAINNDSTAIDALQFFGSASWPAYVRNRHATGLISTAVSTTKGRYGPYLNIRTEVTDISSILVGADMEFFTPIEVVNADGERSTEFTGTESDSS